MVRVLIADDHALIRRGLQQILADAGEDAIIEEASSAEEALELVRQQDWDLLILDINMPGRSGLKALGAAKHLRPSLPVLMLGMHPEGQLAVRCLKTGASGYLAKNSAPEELTRAVRRILSGGHYVSGALRERLVQNLQDGSAAQAHEALSDGEYEVMRLMVSGRTATQITEILSLRVKTVSTYRTRLLAKLGIKTNADLVRYAVEHGLVD
jgi:DNA-binding NarL/FixJ family response regulator